MRLALAAALALGILLVPSARAAGLELSLDGHERPELPGARFEIPFTARVPCEEAGATATLDFTIRTRPEWATVTVAPESVALSLRDCPAAGHHVEGELHVVIASDAPALRPESIALNASLDGVIPQEATADTLVQAAFAPRVEARALLASQAGKPQTALEFPIEIRNLGNGNTKVSFEIRSENGFEAPTPQPVTLESSATGGKVTKQTVGLSVQTPFKNGANHASATILVRYTPSYVYDATLKGAPGELRLFVVSEGVHVAAPASALAAVALALAATLRASIQPGARRKAKP